MAIFITGDTHGAQPHCAYDPDGYMPRFNTRNFPEQKRMSQDDVVIICGDFGGIWDVDRTACRESKAEKYALDWLSKKDFTIAFVPGNHENYDRLTGVTDGRVLESWLFEKMPDREKAKMEAGYPKASWNGGTVRVIRDNVVMMEPGMFRIQGMSVFAFGGAASHDVDAGIMDPADFQDEREFKAEYARMSARPGSFRVRHVSWWDQEEYGPEIRAQAEYAARQAGNAVDAIVTHTCPSSVHAALGFHGHGTTEDFLEGIRGQVSYADWFFGHFHVERDMPAGFHAMYGSIVRIA